jgi:hypothetical protein
VWLRLEKVGSYRSVGASRAFFFPPRCYFRFQDVLGAEVDGVRDDSWRGRFVVWLYLTAKSSHVGGQCGWTSLPCAPAYSP